MRFEKDDETHYTKRRLEHFKKVCPEIYRQLVRLLNDVLDDPEEWHMLKDLRESGNADCIRIAEVFSLNRGPKSTDRIRYDILNWKGKPTWWLVLIYYRSEAGQRPLILMPAFVFRHPNRIY